MITAKSLDRQATESKAQQGIRVISQPDIRWGRCDIKTVGLLPNVLAKEAARAHGGSEVLFVDRDGYVTEGASTNAFIIDQEGCLKTRPIKDNILGGITRATLLSFVNQVGLTFQEVAFSLSEAKAAREVFVTAASSLVMPVIAIDDQPIQDGAPGPITLALRELYIERARASARLY